MKKITILFTLIAASIYGVKAQWQTSGTYTYTNPLTNNVGIGTQTPSNKLTIEGNASLSLLKVKNTSSTAYSEQTFNNDNNNLLTLGTIGSSYQSSEWSGSSYLYSDRKLYIKSADKIDFFTGGYSISNIRMTINNSGFVGIGTPSPNWQLTVKDLITINGNNNQILHLRPNSGFGGYIYIGLKMGLLNEVS